LRNEYSLLNDVPFSLTTEEQDDVVIIGGGPGGYVAAIKAGQLGLKVDNFYLTTCFSIFAWLVGHMR